MKTLTIAIGLGILTAIGSAFAQTTVVQPTMDQKRLEMAKEGCSKSIGFFPTPTKLMCLLTATGQTEKEANPKALAIVFAGCKGQVSTPAPGTTTPAHETLGACLNDSKRVDLINKELAAKGFPAIKVVNPSILKVSAPAVKATIIKVVKPVTPVTKPASY